MMTVLVKVILPVMKQLKQLQRKPRKILRQTHDLHNTSVMLYQLSYEALLVLGQECVQCIPFI